ncbi:Uncharacterised protein [Klebsiella pneumoniae]|nr:Uncharacterised protein [Klebsiella pneumoniae]VFZ95208.1 Uncharacterised protein [Klebsiella pneumoniae]VGB01764.1 Uncharacterised protein [Klebsiella pneumoniae]VGC16615.1 Uncharacterised protein [Klebsiella pneumoniae]
MGVNTAEFSGKPNRTRRNTGAGACAAGNLDTGFTRNKVSETWRKTTKGHLPQRAGVALNERLNTQPEVFRHLGQIITSILNGDGDYFTCALSLHLSVELANGSR